MDPNLFHIDWEQLGEVLSAIIVLSFLIERALALIFEHRLYIKYFNNLGLKEVFAFLFAFLICYKWDFDAVSVLLSGEKTTTIGIIITAGVVAGGSKASIKLFHDVWKVKSQSAAAGKVK